MLNDTLIADPNMPSQQIDLLQTALKIGGFVDFAEQVLLPMLTDGSAQFACIYSNPNFNEWLNTPLNPDPLAYHFEDAMNNLNSDYSSHIPGMKLGLPYYSPNISIYDSVTNPSGDVSIAVIPGQFGFLGGSLIAMTTYSKNQDTTWKYMSKLVDSNNDYINQVNLAQNTLPPYLSAWNNPIWSESKWNIHKLALQYAVAPQYPMSTFAQWSELEGTHVFRFFVMEMIFKNLTMIEALDRLIVRINSAFAPIIAPTTWLMFTDAVSMIVMSFAAIGIFISITLIILLVVLFKKPIVTATSPLFSILILIGT
ncbi:hypothetical protein HK100_004156 [Physocladia obscura]|uniref:Uncharacterized protein n=1 Tax=Physocladia obscura TaxID=109957 RepID=A0AAD5SZ14_9FUNG|nr:hypothetical protein HK100_004156 [Physocladia obscura]